MAKVSLRSYHREIENLIEQGHIEEAVSHCKHILHSYPKCIDTYRLLGDAYLENKRFTDAEDIFTRVLSSTPDDLVSHFDMSRIREDAGDLPTAIWHMERAFEVQPSNTAIQNELRRLYGKRDGMEPPKVRLNRGALARMYARGDLYQQAIAEIRAALVEDAQRPDLQVLLAKMYLLMGKTVEATEVSSEIINKLPYCYEANLMLAKILPGTSRAADADGYRQRAAALDPYAAFVSGDYPASDSVPDNLVEIDHLDWQPSMGDSAPTETAWTSTLGVTVPEKEESQLPDWLSSLEEEPAPEVAPQPDVAAPAETVIPDWMASAGWTTSDDEVVEVPPEAEATEEQNLPLEQAQIPDWLKELAPSSEEEMPQGTPDAGAERDFEALFSAPSTEEHVEASLPAEDLPDWLKSEPTSEMATNANLPDWLKDLELPETEAWTAAPVEAEATSTVSVDKTPEPLETGLPAFYAEESAPEENRTLQSSVEERPEALPFAEENIPSAAVEPAYLASESLAESGDETPSFANESPAQEGELPSWLKELAETPASLEPEAESPTLSFAAGFGEETPEATLASAEESQFAETPAVFPLETAFETTAPASQEAEVTAGKEMSWLENLAAGQDDGLAQPEATPSDEVQLVAPEELPVTPRLHPEAQIPDWVTQMAPQEPFEAQPALAANPVDEEVLPAFAEETVTPSEELATPVAGEETDAALAWLESLAAKQGADEETLFFAPEDRTETPPAWLQTPEAPEAATFTQPAPAVEQPTLVEAFPVAGETQVEAEDAIRMVEFTPETAKAEAVIEPSVAPMAVKAEVISEAAEVVLTEAEAVVEAPAAPIAIEPEELSQAAEAILTEAEAVVEAPAAPMAIEAEELPQAAEVIPTEAETVVEAPAAPMAAETEELFQATPLEAEAIAAAPVPASWVESLPHVEVPASQPEEPLPQWLQAYVEEKPEESATPLPPVEPTPWQSTVVSQPLVESTDSRANTLFNAQTCLVNDDLAGALEHYNTLIGSGEKLEESIHDLRDALNHYPVDINVLQSLGDAYLRSNRLQEALEAYTRAEDLIR